MNINGIITKKKRAKRANVQACDVKTIERVEEKYLITKEQKTALTKKLAKRLKRDEYYKEEVVSIYFDTKNNDLVINSIERPAFREKFRARIYKMSRGKSPVFLEVKSKMAVKKVKIGNKRRLVLSEAEFERFRKGAKLAEIIEKSHADSVQQKQVARELEYLVGYYDLEPKMMIASDRIAFQGKENPEFRLTFDENLRFREKDLSFKSGSKGEKYFPNTPEPKKCIIMEVKTMSAMPPWFVAELSKLKIYPSRFSKYGKIYQLIKERNEKKNV